jgi:hypothetical protein
MQMRQKVVLALDATRAEPTANGIEQRPPTVHFYHRATAVGQRFGPDQGARLGLDQYLIRPRLDARHARLPSFTISA